MSCSPNTVIPGRPYALDIHFIKMETEPQIVELTEIHSIKS